MTELAKNSPKDMPAIQYAGWLCENRLGIPKTPNLLSVIELSIKAIARSKFRDEKWKHPEFTAFVWLDRKCEYAALAGIKMNAFFFMNGDYNEVGEPEKKITEFKPCGQCEWGWKYVDKRKVVPCECRLSWVRENRVTRG